MKLAIVFIISLTANAFEAATTCAKGCPSGWILLPNSGSNHCYLWPTKPFTFYTFWDLQKYCQSQNPTSYIAAPATAQETSALYAAALSKMFPYMGSNFIWIGAYYTNGAFVFVDGTPYGQNPTTVGGKPPGVGSCIYWYPGPWSYRPCTDAKGVAPCEMAPLTICGTVTPPPPYVPPNCASPKMSDFALQKQLGFMPVQELITLTGMTVSSCSIACTYYEGCFSFDISTTGDCRLIGDNVLAQCSQLDNDVRFQHYDKISEF